MHVEILMIIVRLKITESNCPFSYLFSIINEINKINSKSVMVKRIL